jgi:DNA-binding transcriptional regulator YdaS (Cro superfamily)
MVAVPTVYVRTLKRAVEIMGGEEELARRLQVTPSHLELWISGLVSPPGDVFLKAADVVSEYELQRMMTVKHTAPPQATDA